MGPGAKRFMALSLAERLEHVRSGGEYLGSRHHGGHQVHLYRMEEKASEAFFCEVWMRLGLRYVEWIEVASNSTILAEYVKIDVRELFGK